MNSLSKSPAAIRKLGSAAVAGTTILCAAVVVAGIAGCSSQPPITKTGFLSDYASLQPVSDTRMRYIAPELRDYTTFIMDPVQVRSQRGDLTSADRAEISRHFSESLASMLQQRGYRVTNRPGVGTARIRVALTDVREATWWMKLHPGSSLAGAGRGGAAMEGEIIDSVTGQQLAGVVQSGVGSQFTIGNFSTSADVKNLIDQWVAIAGDRLDELRAARP